VGKNAVRHHGKYALSHLITESGAVSSTQTHGASIRPRPGRCAEYAGLLCCSVVQGSQSMATCYFVTRNVMVFSTVMPETAGFYLI
jgi:hypothetical protein